MSQQTFKVSGLHCQSCVRVVSTALGALPTVSAVEVDLGTDGPSTVRVQSGGDLTVEQVQAALSEEGDYSVVG
ncbi:heavy-metal-associated domain-containing protein [Candidatus Mycolicibacterium alkanivorans]|uniref:Heavy-metal-associated domain-containing protein n=1 Tax=Candidatus Mycolicibacterium alkanivorans TaxID=2954114 RepID=A0ABS9YYT6_9MYCO|nr:heavy metal-associated domain-containing protein [Candidatus Mycolicibacterium alkanivorans]MCI4676400.1 heavy-metal-associated domain-containing protein [Candidatus Mycolicibacterium alkanivorans]